LRNYDNGQPAAIPYQPEFAALGSPNPALRIAAAGRTIAAPDARERGTR